MPPIFPLPLQMDSEFSDEWQRCIKGGNDVITVCLFALRQTEQFLNEIQGGTVYPELSLFLVNSEGTVLCLLESVLALRVPMHAHARAHTHTHTQHSSACENITCLQLSYIFTIKLVIINYGF